MCKTPQYRPENTRVILALLGRETLTTATSRDLSDARVCTGYDVTAGSDVFPGDAHNTVFRSGLRAYNARAVAVFFILFFLDFLSERHRRQCPCTRVHRRYCAKVRAHVIVISGVGRLASAPGKLRKKKRF
jgi:hypothetical protein|uniref:Uncharacterized protein n=1 Tax=Sipha flava TaxID=143950 RepID=A0A2S2QPP6_9HEMI